MSSLIKRVSFDNSVFAVDENVYEPAEDSFLFARNLIIRHDEEVLDIGTGCGILGILAAKKAQCVLAVDINPYAIRCAKRNALLNGTQNRMAFLQGDLFGPLRKLVKFDVVLFNAPYLPSIEGMPLSWIEHAWAGGESGREIIDRFISSARDHLLEDGRIMLMQSNLAGVDETILLFEQSSMDAQVTAELDLPFFEKLFLIEARFS